MARATTHQNVVGFHRGIATAHKEINGFYRFNWNEISGKFRSGVQTPALLLESHSLTLEPNQNKVSNFSPRYISMLLLDFTGRADAYDKQEEVLDKLENIGLDIASYLKKITQDTSNREYYGTIDLSTFVMEKVGPIFDNMYGWNIKYTLKNHEPLCYDENQWEWSLP
jgi:hypothetical protein